MFKLVKKFLDNTGTSIISDKAIAALKNPQKRMEIEQAFEQAIKEAKRTGIYKSPEIML